MVTLPTLLLVLSLQADAPAKGDAAATAAQDARFAAMIKGDAAYLDTALDPSLTYQHSTGAYQSKAEFVEAIRTGALKYKGIDVLQRQVRHFGTVVIITGMIRVQAVNATGTLDTKARFTDVYERQKDRLVQIAWQNSRVP